MYRMALKDGVVEKNIITEGLPSADKPSCPVVPILLSWKEGSLAFNL